MLKFLALYSFRRTTCFVFFFATVLSLRKLEAAQGDWEFLANEDGVTIEKRNLATDSLIEVRARGKIHSSIVAILNVLIDNEHYSDWMKSSKQPQLVGVTPGDPNGRVFYNRISPSVLIQDRDFYLATRLSCISLLKQVQLNFTTDPALHYPEKKGVVRLNTIRGHWHFYPSASGEEIMAEYQLYIDAGGSLIKAMKNYAVKKIVSQSFINFRKQVYKTDNRDTSQLRKEFPHLFPRCIS